MVSFPDPKSRHPYHMHSMIHAQPAFVVETIKRVEASPFRDSLSRARHLIVTGCGTSFHAAMYAARILQAAFGNRAVVETVHAYDLAYGRTVHRNATILGVSHSGSTPTTNRALQRAKRAGSRVLGVSGLPSSAMEEIVHEVLVIGSTHDRSWANTMSYTTQLAAFARLAVQMRPDWTDVSRALRRIPATLQRTLAVEPRIKRLAGEVARHDRVTFLATGWDEITAFEAALKIRETCGLTSTAYHAEQFLHGPFLSIDGDDSIVFLRSREDGARADVTRRALSKTGAAVAVVGEHARSGIRLPASLPDVRPIISVVPMQFLAYYVALARHANPDIMRTDILRLHAGVAALFH
jgi:glucosamine--fructose-6-phosphate aminotransferase (isomerizing)